MTQSSTQTIPFVSDKPRHIAVIMDGNGRWAKSRHLPRTAGHIRGIKSVRRAVEFCVQQDIAYLSLFAFSSENWRRPAEEVNLLMRLFVRSLQKEVKKLHQHNIRLRIVGDRSAFSLELQDLIEKAEDLTKDNTGLVLSVCANYGGRWDILQAMQRLIAQRSEQGIDVNLPITEADLSSFLSMAYAPEPDLFIRTGGESRVSNFLIWQLAYTELYFSDKYWPEFDISDFQEAVQWYAQRERRFGRTSAQI